MNSSKLNCSRSEPVLEEQKLLPAGVGLTEQSDDRTKSRENHRFRNLSESEAL